VVCVLKAEWIVNSKNWFTLLYAELHTGQEVIGRYPSLLRGQGEKV
jgi:hypothetical protein